MNKQHNKDWIKRIQRSCTSCNNEGIDHFTKFDIEIISKEIDRAFEAGAKAESKQKELEALERFREFVREGNNFNKEMGTFESEYALFISRNYAEQFLSSHNKRDEQ